MEEKLYKISPPRLQAAVEKAGVPIATLATKARISFPTATWYLTNGGTADAVTVERLAAACGVKPQDILTFDETF